MVEHTTSLRQEDQPEFKGINILIGLLETSHRTNVFLQSKELARAERKTQTNKGRKDLFLTIWEGFVSLD